MRKELDAKELGEKELDAIGLGVKELGEKELDAKELDVKELGAKDLSAKDLGVKKGKNKKQILLRLPPELWDEIAAWAQDDFRSINGQVEYLLAECVRRRKKGEKRF